MTLYRRSCGWCGKFAQTFANRLRRRRPRPGDCWHLDEVFIRINGVQPYLWRAVDQDGIVLDVLVQSRRNTKVAKRFFKKLLKGLQYGPRVVVADHQPTHQRERRMKRFKSPRQAQQFLSAHGPIHQHSHPRRHRMRVLEYRVYRTNAFEVWKQETCARVAA